MSGHGIPHHAENHDQKQIGIFISILAVLMAVVSALANNAGNQKIVKQVEASNGYAWYQSKRQRSYMNDLEIERITRDLAGNPTAEQRKLLEAAQEKLRKKNAEYATENDEINAKAKANESLAVLADHRHHRFEYGEILLHIAVVLCSLTLLTESKLYFKIGVVATIAGLLLAGSGFLLQPHSDGHGADQHPAAQTPSTGH